MKYLKYVLYLVFAAYFGFLAARYIYQWNIKRTFTEKVANGSLKLANADNFLQYKGYNEAELVNKLVVNVQTGKTDSLKKFIKSDNVFFHFWYIGCRDCQIEMPELADFYKNLGTKIDFVLISNDPADKIRAHFEKKGFKMPTYALVNQTFPEGVWVFPTSHLKLKGETVFNFAGKGNFRNESLYSFLNSKIAF